MKKGSSLCFFMRLMASVATIPSVCSSSVPSASSQLNAPEIFPMGLGIKNKSFVSFVAAFWIDCFCHEGASSKPSVPMLAGTL